MITDLKRTTSTVSKTKSGSPGANAVRFDRFIKKTRQLQGQFSKFALTLLVSVCVPVAAFSATVPLDVNLAPDAGFENRASGWVGLPQNFSIVNSTARSGNYCMQVTNLDPNVTDMAKFVSTPVAVGAVYSCSVWVKTIGVSTTGPGATLAAFWVDSNGNYIDGKYRDGATGTTDWAQIDINTPPMPAQAAGIAVLCYLGRGVTGTAFYDDIDLRINDSKLVFRPVLRFPNYRSTIYPGQFKIAKVGVEIKGNGTHPTSSLMARLSVLDASGKSATNGFLQKVTGKPWEDLSVSLANCPAGSYKAVVSLVDSVSAQTLDSKTFPFTIAPAGSPMPKVYVGQYNRLVVDGKAFFPLGFYTSGSKASDWDLIAKMGYNCILDYGMLGIRPLSDLRANLDQIAARNLKVIFSLKGCYDIVPDQRPDPVQEIKYGEWDGAFEVFKGLVDGLKDHPSILAWYINDELTKGYLPQIKERNDYIASVDPNHPTYQVMNTVEDADLHLPYADVMGYDVYPVLYQCEQSLAQPPMEKMAWATDMACTAGMNSRGIWMVPECSSQKSMTSASRPPNFKEVICESYQCIAAGARGLVFYHFWELLHDDGPTQVAVMTKVAMHLNALKPFSLGTDAPANQILTSSDARVRTLTRTVGTGYSTYAIAVNPYNVTVPCTFRLGPATPATSIVVGLPGIPQRTIAVSNGSFSDSIEPYGVRVYKLK